MPTQRPSWGFDNEQTPVNKPVDRCLTSKQFIHGGGVAIFHVASARVVVVHHTLEKTYFLPKGRKDVGEDSITGAEREGYEETGFRNRVLPLPHQTAQTWAVDRKASFDSHPSTRFHTEPIATNTMIMGRTHPMQYILSWYIAETLPPAVEAALNNAAAAATTITKAGSPQASTAGTAVSASSPAVYQIPPRSNPDESIAARIALEGKGYEPQRQELSTVQRDEVYYFAELVSIEVACERLQDTGQDWIVRRGWAMIQERMRLEKEWSGAKV